MKKLAIGITVPLMVSAGLWLGLAGNAHAKTLPAKSRPAAVSVSSETTQPDTDNVQSGDQTTPDSTGAATAASQGNGNGQQGGNGEGGENQGENEGNNDGPGGHQDPAGNVNHECTGNCQE